jgi:hypothetical protein
MRRQETVKRLLRPFVPVKLDSASVANIRNALFGGYRHRREVGARRVQPFIVDNSDFPVDRVGNFPRGKRKPRLVVVAAAYTRVCVLKNMIAHVPLHVIWSFATKFGTE